MSAIWHGIVDEFSDLPDAAGTTRVVLRLVMAACWEGFSASNELTAASKAGLRTHMLVAVGAALFVLVPERAGWSQDSIARIIQGLLAGIGFLGAGVILHIENRKEIEGLTTAANIWFTAAIGVTVGLGRQATAILSAPFSA